MVVVDPGRVEELIASYGSNHVQAIKAVQSRYKKELKTGNPFLLLTLADLLSRQGNYENAESHMQQFLQSKDIAADRHTVEKLYNLTAMTNKRKGNFAKTVGPDVIKTFEAAAKKQKPTGGMDDIIVILFRVAFSHHNWKDAQTASRLLRQRYPREQSYLFLFIASCELAARTATPDEQFFKLAMEKTAYTILTKSIGNTFEKKEAVEKLVDIRQFHVLVQVYNELGHFKELSDILGREEELLSVIPELQAEEVQTLRLNALSKFDVPTAVFEQAFNMIDGALKTKNDSSASESAQTAADNILKGWNIWKHMVNAMNKMENQTDRSTAKEKFEKQVNAMTSQPSSKFYETRSASLARLMVASKSSLSENDFSGPAVQYFKESCAQPTCFTDLRTTLSDVTKESINSFYTSTHEIVATEISDASPRESFTISLHHLRFRYLVAISLPEKPTATDIESFITAGLELVKKGVDTKEKNTSTACYLTAVGLIHLAFHTQPEEPELDHLIQAAYLLDWIGTDMQNPGAQLLGVKLQLYLGLFPTAYTSFSKLRVKNIVVDSLAYHMYARISTQNPLGSLGGQHENIAGQLSEMLTRTYTDNVNGQWKKEPIRAWRKALPQVDALLDIAEQETKLDKSLSRAIFRIENRRCQRVTISRIEDNDPPIDKVEDLHDGVEYLPDWCIGWKEREHQFLDLIQEGPKIGRHWLAAFILVDDTCSRIWNQNPVVPSTTELEAILTSDNGAEILKKETTASEFAILEGWNLFRACVKTASIKSLDASTFKKDHEIFATWVKENLPTERSSTNIFGKPFGYVSVLPTTTCLQTLYLAQELTFAALQFFLSRLPTLIREDEKRLKKHIPQTLLSEISVPLLHSLNNISEILTSFRTSIDKNARKGIQNAIANTEIGQQIMKALGEEQADSVVDKYYVSARNTVEAAVKLNLGLRKWVWASAGGQSILGPVWQGKKGV